MARSSLTTSALRTAPLRAQSVPDVVDQTHPLSVELSVHPGYSPFSAGITSTPGGIGSPPGEMSVEDHVGTHVDAHARSVVDVDDDVASVPVSRLLAPPVAIEVSSYVAGNADTPVGLDDPPGRRESRGNRPTTLIGSPGREGSRSALTRIRMVAIIW